MLRPGLAIALVLAFSCFPPPPATAAPPTDSASALRNVLHWRAIGPARGGRTIATTGVPGRPHDFYIAAVNGGSSRRPIRGAPGRRQRPDLAVGNGIYKSTDGGAHLTHLGLRDGQQIPKIVVDPRDPDRLYVVVLGHPYGPNSERGVYRSTDGGANFERVHAATLSAALEVLLGQADRAPKTAP